MAYSFQFGESNSVVFAEYEYITDKETSWNPVYYVHDDIIDAFWEHLFDANYMIDHRDNNEAKKIIWLIRNGIDFRVSAEVNITLTWTYEEHGHFFITIPNDEDALWFKLNYNDA